MKYELMDFKVESQSNNWNVYMVKALLVNTFYFEQDLGAT